MIRAEVRNTARGGRRMTEEELQQFLSTIRYGTLSFVNEEGWPDMRPMNFGYYNGCFYFHGHRSKGEMRKALTDGKQVVISFYETSDTVGIEHHNTHKNVLVYGRIQRLEMTEDNLEELYGGLTAMCMSAGTPWKAEPERLKKTVPGAAAYKVIPEYTVGKLVCFLSTPPKED